VTLLHSYCKIAFSIWIIHNAKASFVGNSSWSSGFCASSGCEVVDGSFEVQARLGLWVGYAQGALGAERGWKFWDSSFRWYFSKRLLDVRVVNFVMQRLSLMRYRRWNLRSLKR
jgi:hypothetical protein